MNEPGFSSPEHDQTFRRLAEAYAEAVDRNRPELLDAIMTEDAVIEGPGFLMSGLAEIRAIPQLLKQSYGRTRHLIHNQRIVVDGDRGTGDTYCTASHLLRPELPASSAQVLDWHFRYQDVFERRAQGEWRFRSRQIVIDWTETRTVSLPE